MISRRSLIGATSALALTLMGAPMAHAGEMSVTASGTFEGRSNHETTGSVKIIEEDGRTFVVLGEDFSLDNGPDPRVNFGKDGAHDADAYLGALTSLTGEQRYAVPPTWDVSGFNELYIWCEVAGVPLGVATLR